MSKELDTAIEAAREAGEFQLSKLHTKHSIKAKGSKDFATDVDMESEKIILDTIAQNFPEHSILSEESGEKQKSSEFKWIIDPLDGTHSYMTGLPNFGVSIALEKEGEVVVGAIFLPCFGELLAAEKGKGAFLNSKGIAVSKTQDLQQAGGSFELNPGKNTLLEYSQLCGSLFDKIINMRTFGGVCDFSMVASGRMDFSLSADTHPWDCAAASLIIEEAGGKLTDFSGKAGPYISTVVASNGLLHDNILKELNSK